MTKKLSRSDEILGLLLQSIADMESEKPRGKPVPCVVEWKLFSSFTDAAYWLARNRPELWMHTRAAQNQDAYRVMRGLISLVRRRCWNHTNNGKGYEGWFCAEEGDPDTWNTPPKDYMEDVSEFEDLRR